MDKSELIEIIYEYIEKNKYDKRFIPFMQSYILKCVQIYNWNKKTLIEKLNEYTNKIKNIEFLNIGRQRIFVDVENKTILIDERIKYNTEDYTLEEYIEASYKEQDKILSTSTYLSLENSNNHTLKEEIKYIFKTYNRKLIEEKVAFEIIGLIEQKDYNKKFIPFIKEYFLRSTQIYNWNRDELVKKINNFKNNVDAIEVKKLKGKCAEYNIQDKKIYLNKNLLTYSNDVIIKNIFREQGYATNYTKIEDKVYENGLYSGLVESDSDERQLNEYVEEISANYLTGRVPYSNELYTTCRVSEKDRKDYNNKIAYIGSMMAAAFGINEFEFAILKDKGRARFYEYFRARFEYMNTEEYINEFFEIATNLQNASDSMFSTKEITNEYAKMYNLSMKILNERINHESEGTDKKQLKEIKTKLNYAKYKIVNTLKQAKRNQCLESRIINKITEDKETIRKYSKVTKISQYKFKKVARKIYSDNDTLFDNTELISTIVKDFKFPILGKIYRIFNKDENLLLISGTEESDWVDSLNEDINIRKKELSKAKIVIPAKESFNFKE